MGQLEQGARRPRKPPIECAHHVSIAEQHANGGHDVVRAPGPSHVGLACTQHSPGKQIGPEDGVVHRDGSGRPVAPTAEGHVAVGITDA